MIIVRITMVLHVSQHVLLKLLELKKNFGSCVHDDVWHGVLLSNYFTNQQLFENVENPTQ